jgi:hypothetical protein
MFAAQDLWRVGKTAGCEWRTLYLAGFLTAGAAALRPLELRVIRAVHGTAAGPVHAGQAFSRLFLMGTLF